jgi:hypothetical protein
MPDLYRHLFRTNGPYGRIPLVHSRFTLYALLEGIYSRGIALKHKSAGVPGLSEEDIAYALIEWLFLLKVFEDANRRTEDVFALRLRWHSVHFGLATDFKAIEQYATTESPVEQQELKSRLSRWSTTISARRAFVHAAAFRLLYEKLPRGQAEPLHLGSGCFRSAILLLILAGYQSPASQPSTPSLVRLEDVCDVELETLGKAALLEHGRRMPASEAVSTNKKEVALARYLIEGGDIGWQGVSLTLGHFWIMSYNVSSLHWGLSEKMAGVMDKIRASVL